MTDVGDVSDRELLHALLTGAPVRVAAFDRSGRLLLDPDPNPPLPTDHGVPAGANFLDLYGHIAGIREAVQTAFSGDVARLTRLMDGGATYMGTFFPRPGPRGSIDSVIGVAAILPQTPILEQALAELQARERSIFHSSMIGLMYWNERGVITDANDVLLAQLGFSRDDFTTGLLTWDTLLTADGQRTAHTALDELRTRGTATPFEAQVVGKDGQPRDVLIGVSAWGRDAPGGVGFVLDLGERKRQEQQRLAAEGALARVVGAAPIVLWSVDADGRITLTTGRGLAALGMKPGQFVGQSVYEISYGQMPQVATGLRRALDGEETSASIDVGDLTFETLFSPLHDATGAVSGVLGVSIDMTERRRAEIEHEHLRMQLLQVQKLESLGLLAGGIAHDFNNILTAILGGASSAMLTIAPENPARQDLDNVIAAAQRAATLTRQMLAYSGKGRVEVRPIDLSNHVREIATLLETTVPKKVQLRLELSPDLPAIEADVAQVQQIIMNLVINGAEAIGDQRGTVLVITGAQEIDPLYATSLFAAEGLAPGHYVFLEVHDTGHGMDEVTKGKIFDPFFTTKFTGRGLGLAAVLGIVRGHRGAIKVYSSPGRGTTFKVFFPSSSATVLPEPRKSELEYRGQGLVLVIDDDAAVRVATRRLLEYFGFSVIEAGDGQAGSELFAQRAAEIALVVVDMTMPKMNGEETFRAIRYIRKDVPVLLTSGYNEIEATRRFTSKGLAGFLEKPFTPGDLATKLARILPPREH